MIMTAIPAMRTVMTDFFISYIALHHKEPIYQVVSESTVIHVAREKLTQVAIDSGCDKVLWLDSDMKFSPDILDRLSADIDEGREIVTGICVKRVEPILPVIYDKIEFKDGIGEARHYLDYPKDSVFEIAGCGFAGAMTTVDFLRRMKDKYERPFDPFRGLSEDLSFCYRARNIGTKIYCDSRIKFGHIGNYEYTEEDYLKGRAENEG